MKYSRSLGYFLFNHPEYKEDIISTLSLKNHEYEKFVEGRLLPTYSDLQKIAKIINKPVSYLINLSNNDNCYKGMIHSEGNFSNQENCEKILDLIDSYIDIVEAVNRYVHI